MVSVTPAAALFSGLIQSLPSLSPGSEELKRMAHSKARATDGKVTYPPGVKEISDKISKEEMVRRLKVGVSPCCVLLMASLHERMLFFKMEKPLLSRPSRF